MERLIKLKKITFINCDSWKQQTVYLGEFMALTIYYYENRILIVPVMQFIKEQNYNISDLEVLFQVDETNEAKKFQQKFEDFLKEKITTDFYNFYFEIV